MLIPVILSGGAGSRLWPVSREASPKPFMKVGDGESLLRKTFDRALRAGRRRRRRHRHEPRVPLQDARRVRPRTRPRARSSSSRSAATPPPRSPWRRCTPRSGTARTRCCCSSRPTTSSTTRPPSPPTWPSAESLARQGLLVTFGILPDAARDGLRLHRDGRGHRRGPRLPRRALRGEALPRARREVRGERQLPVELGHVLLRPSAASSPRSPSTSRGSSSRRASAGRPARAAPSSIPTSSRSTPSRSAACPTSPSTSPSWRRPRTSRW